MSATDFHHPLLGDVLRVDPDLLVKSVITPDLLTTTGEWGGLQNAAVLISRRFPSKSRGYAYHVPKSLTVSLVHEASVMWKDALTESATRGFRRSVRGTGDIEMSWLSTFLRVERWREALLWTWAVARLGGADETWGRTEVEEVIKLFNVGPETGDLAVVRKGERKTLEDVYRLGKQMGWDKPAGTGYVFCKSSIFPRVLRNLPQRQWTASW